MAVAEGVKDVTKIEEALGEIRQWRHKHLVNEVEVRPMAMATAVVQEEISLSSEAPPPPPVKTEVAVRQPPTVGEEEQLHRHCQLLSNWTRRHINDNWDQMNVATREWVKEHLQELHSVTFP